MSIAKKTTKKPAPTKAAARTPVPKKPAAKAPAKAQPAPAKPAAKKPAVPVVVPIAPAAPAAPIEGQQQPPAANNLSRYAMTNLQGLAADAAKDNPPAPGAEGEENQQTPEQQAAEAEEAARQAQMAAMGGQMLGGIAVGAIEKGVQFFYPFVQIPGEQKVGLQMSFADVMSKYGSSGVMPPWFVQFVLPYLEELKLLGKLGALIVGIVGQVNQENMRLEEEARKAAEASAKQNGQQPGPDFSTGAAASA
jgi:hypothetical protein